MPRPAQYDREAALQAAVNLFWRQGYYATSLKDIEKALDMRPGSLYAAFGNKQALFDQALGDYANTMVDELQASMEQAGSVLDGVMAYLARLLLPSREAKELPAPACMVVKTLLESADGDPLGPRAAGLLEDMECYFAAALERAQASGELREGVDCRRLARLVQAQVMGARCYAQRGPDEQSMRDLLADVAMIFEPYRAVH